MKNLRSILVWAFAIVSNLVYYWTSHIPSFSSSIVIICLGLACIGSIGLVIHLTVQAYRFLKASRIKREQEKARREQELQLQNEVDALLSKYRVTLAPHEFPTTIKTSTSCEIVGQKITEVLDGISSLNSKIQTRASDLKQSKEMIDQILECHGCKNNEEKKVHLQENEEKLVQLKTDIDRPKRNCLWYKLEFNVPDNNHLTSLRKAVEAIGKSICIKDISSEERRKEFRRIDGIAEFLPFIDTNMPSNVSCFDMHDEPLVFNMPPYKYIIGESAILVFREHLFVTALPLSALSIEVGEREMYVCVFDNKDDISSYSDAVAKDCRIIERGQNSRTWEHTCKDGSPDMRYKNNSSWLKRYDKVALGWVHFTIAEQTVAFEFSNYSAIDIIREAQENLRNIQSQHNPIPNLLKLLALVSPEQNSDAHALKQTYISTLAEKHYFCRVVEVI